MSFLSKASKAKSKATVNKLFEKMLPGSSSASSQKSKSTTEQFHSQASKNVLLREAIRKASKVEKIKRNKQINKKGQDEKKFKKLVTYNVIKNHKLSDNISEEESKFLKKLIKKNSSLVRRHGDLDDPMIKDEIEQIRSEIIALSNEKFDRSKARQQSAKLQAFTEKVNSGKVAYPGLTPGLAPVGLDDESDDE